MICSKFDILTVLKRVRSIRGGALVHMVYIKGNFVLNFNNCSIVIHLPHEDFIYLFDKILVFYLIEMPCLHS